VRLNQESAEEYGETAIVSTVREAKKAGISARTLVKPDGA